MEEDHKEDKTKSPGWERVVGDKLLSALGMKPEHWTTADRRLAFLWFFVGLLIFIIATVGYQVGWKWTGVTERTFWDWLNLLIVPFVLALGGYMFTRSESRRAEQHRQDDILQAYLNGMSQLLIEKDWPSREAPQGSSLRPVARALTLTVLETLDGGLRKRRVLRFLYESELICKDKNDGAVVRLNRADLSGADLRGAGLSEADLRGADLRGADLSGAGLSEADLRGADLTGAEVTDEQLRKAASFEGATMPGASPYP